MKDRITGALLVAIAAAAFNAGSPETPDLAAARRAVLVLGAQSHESVGCATLIDGKYVSCYHVAAMSDLRADGAALSTILERTAELAVVLPPKWVKVREQSLSLATDPPRLGESVWCVGSPYGYRGSVTRGIVSGLRRELTMPDGVTLKDVIQTDAAVNPGSSGGPLLNRRGEVLGIVVAYRSEARGMAFAIPASQVRDFLERHNGTGK